MDSSIINSVSREVYRRFPDLQGRTPRVQPLRSKPARSGLRLFRPLSARRTSPGFVLVYAGRRTTVTGKTLLYAVRVTVDAHGNILKMTMTH